MERNIYRVLILSLPLILMLAFLFMTPLASTAGHVTDGLVAFYDGSNNLNGSHDKTSTTWKDSSGNGNDITGIPINDGKNGWRHNAYHLDSTKVDLPAVFTDTINNYLFTIEVVLDNVVPKGTLITFMRATSGNRFSLQRNISTDKIEFKFRGDSIDSPEGVASSDYFSSPITIALTSFKEIGRNDYTVVMYINGVPIKSVYNSNNKDVGTIFFGNEDATRMFSADYKSIRLYDRALTADEIVQNYNKDIAVNPSGFPGSEYTVDIQDLQGEHGNATVGEFSAAGYGDMCVIQMNNYNTFQYIANLDLSRYESVTIRYGADANAAFVGDDKNTTLRLTTKNFSDDTLATVNLAPIEGAWANGEVTITMDLSNVKYIGELYLALDIQDIDGRNDGIAISRIVFNAKTKMDKISFDTIFKKPVGEAEVTLKDGGLAEWMPNNYQTYDEGTVEYIALRGWTGDDAAIVTFGYKINDGDFISGEFKQDTEQAVLNAGGQYASRFKINIATKDLAPGTYVVDAYALLDNDNLLKVLTFTFDIKEEEEADTEPGTDPAEYYNVVISGLVGKPGNANIHVFTAAGYNDYIIQMGNFNTYQYITDLNLSKYESVTIRYGADGGAVFEGEGKNTTLRLTTNDFSGDNLATVNLKPVNGGWASGEVSVTMDLADVDYNGPLYLAIDIQKIGGRNDGIAVSSIVFKAKEEEPTKTEMSSISFDTIFKKPVGGDEVTLKDGGLAEWIPNNYQSYNQGTVEHIAVRGWTGDDAAIVTFGYKINGDNFISGEFKQDTEQAVLNAGGQYASRFKINIATKDLAPGTYVVDAYALLDNNNLLKVLTYTFDILPDQKMDNTYFDEVGFKPVLGDEVKLREGEPDMEGWLKNNEPSFEEGEITSIYLRGWAVDTSAIVRFGYQINDGTIVYGDYKNARDDVVEIFGEKASGYRVDVLVGNLEEGSYTVTVFAELEDGRVLKVNYALFKIIKQQAATEPSTIPSTGDTFSFALVLLAMSMALVIIRKKVFG